MPLQAPGMSRRAARNAMIFTVAEILGKLSTLVLTVVAARELGPVDFGAFAYSLSFALLAATIPTWGFGTIVIREGAMHPERLSGLLGHVIKIRALVSVPLILVAGGITAATRPTMRSSISVVLILVAALLDVVGDAGGAAATAKQDLGGVSVALVVNRLTSALLGGAALIGGLGLVGVSAGFLVGSAIGLAVMWRAIRRLDIRPRFRDASSGTLRDLVKRATPVGLNTLVAMALFRVDALMLEQIKGEAELGNYAAAYRLLEAALFVTFSVALAILPEMSASREAWKVRRAFEEGWSALATMYLAFATVLLLEPHALLAVLFGPAYADAGATPARWLAMAPLLFSLSYLAGSALYATGRYRQVLLVNGLATVGNIAANLALIPELGATGAAAATTGSFAFQALLMLTVMARTVGWPRVERALMAPVAGALVMAAALLLLDLHVLVEVAISSVLFLAAWAPLASKVAPQQLDILRSFIPGLRRASAPADGGPPTA